MHQYAHHLISHISYLISYISYLSLISPSSPLIRHLRTNRLTIHADHTTPLNLDGEIRLAQNIEISVAPERIRFFHPKDTRVIEFSPAPL